MKVTKKALKNSQVELKIELTTEDLEKYRKVAIKGISKEVKIDGFRAGTEIPEDMVIKKVGEEAVKAEAVRTAITKSYLKALEEKDLYALSQPKIDVTSESPLKFTVTVDVKPEITLKDYKKVSITPVPKKVTKKDIDVVIEDLKTKVKDYKEVKRAAKKDDQVVLDFAGFDMKGEPVENTKAEKQTLIIGAGQFIPWFEENAEGMKAGDEKEFKITFPADYQAKEMAGKDFNFKIKIHEVKEPVAPKIDENFVEKITGKKESVENLLKEIEKNLEERNKQEARQKAENDLLVELAKLTTFDIPQVLIDEEIEFLIDNIKMQGLQYGMPWEKYLEIMKKTEDDIRKEVAKDASGRVTNRLIIQEIIKIEGFKADEKEVLALAQDEYSRLQPAHKAQAKESDYEKGGKRYEYFLNYKILEQFFALFIK